jgi:hypothetical protein
VHDVFHVSQLKKCEQIPEAQIIDETNAEIEPDLSLAEYPMRVLDQKERQTRRQRVNMYKIQWSHHTEEEATLENEQFLTPSTPTFFQVNLVSELSSLTLDFESRDEIPVKGGRL